MRIDLVRKRLAAIEVELSALVEQMEEYAEGRSEEWEESDAGALYGEVVESIPTVIDALQDVLDLFE